MAHVTLTRADDGIATLRADRPPANAMNVDLLEELVAAVRDLAADPPAAMVLTGRPGCFSAGADLKAVPTYGAPEQRRMVEGINEMALGVYGLPCPVVASITGHAIAGGFVLALCADQLVASYDGRYGLTEIKVGVPFPQAALGVCQAELSPPAARRLIFGSQLHDAREMVRLGVFDEACEPEQVEPRALDRARALAALPADTYTRTKRDLRGPLIARLTEAARTDPLLEVWVQRT